MLKTPRYYITRPRRRRTGTRKQIVKKELQKEKLNVKGKVAKVRSDLQEGNNVYRDILEKFKEELKSCSVTLLNIDIQAAVLTYKPTNKSFLYKISANSYVFRKSSQRGRKRKLCNMNKYHGDSQNNTGSSSAYQGSREERQFSQYPVPRKQCAKKSTTQLARNFNLNRSNSGWDGEVMPGKRKRDSTESYRPRSETYGAAYDIDRDQALANGEERSWSRDRNYCHTNSVNHREQYHDEPRSQRNSYREYSPSDNWHDGRRRSEERDRSYQSTRSYHNDHFEYSYSDNSGRPGRHTRREFSSRERSQERVPPWRDGTLSNRGKTRYGRHGDDVNEKPATRSRNSSPSGNTKSTSRDTYPEAKIKSSTSSSKTPSQPAFRKAKEKDRDCGNQGDPTSATNTDQSNKAPGSKLTNSISDSIKDKKSLTPKPSDVKNSKSTSLVTGAVSKTSTSNAQSGPDTDRSSKTIAETNGVNSPIPSQSSEKNHIPSATKDAQRELEHISKSHGFEDSLALSANGSSDSNHQLDSVNVSSLNASNKEQVTLSKVMPSITNESASKEVTVSSDRRVLEKAKLNTLSSVTGSPHITSANPEDSFKDVSLKAVAPGERKTNLKEPSLIQENDKTVDPLDLETPDTCNSSPARPDVSARETTNKEVSKNPTQNSTVDIPAPTRTKLQELPSPLTKVDANEGPISSFRLKLKSIVDKVFPKANASSVTKDESNFLSKSLPASPKTSGEDIEVDSKNPKCKNSTKCLQMKNNEVTATGIPSGHDQLEEPSAAVVNISSLKDVYILPVCQNSTETTEYPTQLKEHFGKASELAVEGIKDVCTKTTSNKDGYGRPKPVEKSTDKLADIAGKKEYGLCPQSSGSLSTSLSKDCEQAAQTTSLPNLKECLDDRTNITDGSSDQSNSEQIGKPRTLDPDASQEPSLMETDQESEARESPMPSEVQSMEVDSPPLEEHGVSSGTTALNKNELLSLEKSITKLQEEKEMDSQNDNHEKTTVASLINLVISNEMSLKPTEIKERVEMKLNPVNMTSAPGIDKHPTDTSLSVNQETGLSAGLDKTSLAVQEVDAATTTAGRKVPEEPSSMDAKEGEAAGDSGRCIEAVKPGKISSLETGKRARSPSLEETASDGEERNSNKKSKLDDSLERVKGDQRVAKDDLKDPPESMHPVKKAATSSSPLASPQLVETVVNSSEPVDSLQPVKKVVKSGEPVASPQTVKTVLKSLEQVASPQPVTTDVKSMESVVAPQPLKTAVTSSKHVASPRPVKTVVNSSEPVKTVVKTSEPVTSPKTVVNSSEPVNTVKKTPEPVASPQQVKTAVTSSEPVASQSNQVETAEPTKPDAVPRKSSATPPLSQAPSQSGAPPARRTGKSKQMTTKDLRLMIEKHAQASLQAHLKLLRRQLEISSKGERMWETRCQETQKQLEIVQGELSKVKEEGDSMKSKIAELYNCKENLTKKLHEKGIEVNTASNATQYDCDDFTEVMDKVLVEMESSETLPVSNPIVISDPRPNLLESGNKSTSSSLNEEASMKVAEAPNVANATVLSSADAKENPLFVPPLVPHSAVQPQTTTPESIPAVSAGPSVTPNAEASKETRIASLEPALVSSQPQAPPTMICLEKPNNGTSVLPPKLAQHTIQGVCSRVTSVQATASPGALIVQTASPDTTAVVTNNNAALPRKALTPEIQEIELPPRSTPGKQVVPSPRVRQSQSPQTLKSGSPAAQTPPRGLIPITSQHARTTGAINVSIVPNVTVSAKSARPQKVTTPVTKLQTPLVTASQKTAATPQANRNTTSEHVLIDLTDDMEEPSGSVAKQPAVKTPQATTTVASLMQQPQSTASKRTPPSYGYHQTSTGQIAPSNTQGSITRRTGQQQEAQSPHKPATQMVRPNAQQPRPQVVSPRHFTVAPPNRTVGTVQYRMPSVHPRQNTPRLPQVNSMVSAVSVPQATAHSTLNTSQVSSASTPVRYINPALMANVSMALNHSFANTNTSTAVAQHAPIAAVTAYPMSAQQIRSVAPILQGMSVPIVTQALNNVFFPSAVQAGIPAGRLPQQVQGVVRTPQNTISATQVVTQLQQQQQQQQMQHMQMLAQQQLLQKHQAQQQQAQQQQAQQQAQQQQAHQQQAQQAQQQQAQQQQAQKQHAQQQQVQQQQAQQQQAQQQHQIQQQMMQQKLQQHQQKARAAEEQRQQASQQQKLQLQLQHQQVTQAKHQQLQAHQHVQKLQNQQLQQQRALIQQTVQKVHSANLELKKKLDLVNKDFLTVQAKLQNKENMTFRQRDLEMQLRHLDSQKQQLQGEINKNASLHQQHQQTYERLMASINNTAMNANPNAATKLGPPSHPAPLPALQPSTSKGPPKPELNITKVETGIVLSWNMTLDGYDSQIDVYHLYAYQESEAPATTTLWKKIGEVRALPLPMACTLTQFQAGSVYHFAVCAVDIQGQSGPFSEPSSINLPRN
ncbi:uncharacterized protein [Asterias amurensis]|uniref:uncharacterized protein isoform X2 n=1 Tax=Asterias amurensis TaxID=7602 RepID=UPI003AB3805A